ncbi:ABC transporter permease [Gemmatimonadales bacterium]|nr:ABC transporter permease [Gemmatimonadales bacterium]
MTREAVAAFRRAPTLTALSAGMVGLSLYVVGLFSLVTYNLQIALSTIEERVEIVVYIRDSADQSEIDALRAELMAFDEVAGANHLSKSDALERAQRDLPEFGQLFLESEVNPLPQSIEVALNPENRTPEVAAKISQAAQDYPFVEDALYGEEWVDQLFALRRIGFAIAAALGAVFAMVAALMIGLALRIAIFARREEIYIMRLVGARSGFIRGPFLLEGALVGLAGGTLAAGLTYASYRGLSIYMSDAAWIPLNWVAIGLIAGSLFGAISSAVAIHRHLQEV